MFHKETLNYFSVFLCEIYLMFILFNLYLCLLLYLQIIQEVFS